MEARIIVSIYIGYKCLRCHKETILITEEVTSTLNTGRYISCSHCGCKKILKEMVTSNLQECMNHSSYKKVNGVTRQVR